MLINTRQGRDGYIHTWRMTDNGLEGIAQAHYDTLLCLDELKQCDPATAAQIVYQLGNGRGKVRANDYGKGLPKPPKTWRLVFLSTGEISLEQHVRSAGLAIHAGQEVRLLDIPITHGTYGVFDELHGYADGARFAEAFSQAATTSYGTAGRAFIAWLIANGLAAMTAKLSTAMASFLTRDIPEDTHGQVIRAAQRFALVAVAGELATEAGITGWPPGAATTSSQVMFSRWLSERGSTGALEAQQILDRVSYFLELHGTSRFALFHCAKCDGRRVVEGDDNRLIKCYACEGTGEPLNDKTLHRAGFRKADSEGVYTYYVLPGAFKQDLCQGLDAKLAAQVLTQAGWLAPGENGKSQKKVRLPGMSASQRCYVIRPYPEGTPGTEGNPRQDEACGVP